MLISVDNIVEADPEKSRLFVSLIQFMPMSKNYIPKMGSKKAVRLPTLP